MEIPLHVQSLIDHYLEVVRHHPEHRISPLDRITLYKSFGPSNYPDRISRKNRALEEPLLLFFSEADQAFAWLATITARRVLPIWEQAAIEDNDDYYSCSAAKMIETAEGVLKNPTNATEAYDDLCGRFYTGRSNLCYRTTGKTYFANSSANAALEATLIGIEGLRFYSNDPGIIDEDTRYTSNDFAALANLAFSAIDVNEPGAWIDFQLAEWEKDSNTTPPEYMPITYDPQKRLEFWEWWLIEAIPQAWSRVNASA